MVLSTAIPLQLASLDGFLFFLIIVGLSALSNWLQKRQQAARQAREEEEGGVPAEQPVVDWEAELRRLLDEENQPTPPQPPTLVEEPAPPTPAFEDRRTVAPPATAPLESAPSAGPTPVVGKLAREVERADEEVRHRQRAIHERVGYLKEAASRQVRHLEEDVARRAGGLLRRGWRGPAFPTTADRRRQRRPVPPSVRRLMDALRTPDAAREAVLAYEVMGPPKALGSRPSAAWEFHLPPAE